jgi:hypothetical protein
LRNKTKLDDRFFCVPACQKNFSRYADALRAKSLRFVSKQFDLIFVSRQFDNCQLTKTVKFGVLKNR